MIFIAIALLLLIGIIVLFFYWKLAFDMEEKRKNDVWQQHIDKMIDDHLKRLEKRQAARAQEVIDRMKGSDKV